MAGEGLPLLSALSKPTPHHRPRCQQSRRPRCEMPMCLEPPSRDGKPGVPVSGGARGQRVPSSRIIHGRGNSVRAYSHLPQKLDKPTIMSPPHAKILVISVLVMAQLQLDGAQVWQVLVLLRCLGGLMNHKSQFTRKQSTRTSKSRERGDDLPHPQLASPPSSADPGSWRRLCLRRNCRSRKAKARLMHAYASGLEQKCSTRIGHGDQDSAVCPHVPMMMSLNTDRGCLINGRG